MRRVAREGVGVYCVKANGVSSATRTLVATVDYRGNGVSHLAQWDSDPGACTNSGGWLVRTREVGGAPPERDLTFSVVIP